LFFAVWWGVFEDSKYDAFFLESLKGRLAFWSYIEPDVEYPVKAIAKLDELSRAIFV